MHDDGEPTEQVGETITVVGGQRASICSSRSMPAFDDLIQHDPTNAYGYIGKAYVLRHHIQKETDPVRKKVLQANELSLLEEAYEVTGQSNVAASALATARERMGDTDDAIEVLRVGLDRKPTDNRLRDLWIRYEIDRDNPEEALEIATEGARIDPTSWRMQRHIARLKNRLERV